MAGTSSNSRAKLIPELDSESEYLEALRIAKELHKTHEALGGLERRDAVKLAVFCAAFEGSIEWESEPISENDFAEQRATLQAVADSIKRKPVGLVRIAAPDPNRLRAPVGR